MENKIREKAEWVDIREDADSNLSSNPTSITHCYSCGIEVPPGAEYCGSCGVQLYLDCPNCKSRFLSKYSFCPTCGTDYKEHFCELENLRVGKQKIDEFNVFIDDTIRSTNEYKEGLEYLTQEAKKACIKKCDNDNGWAKIAVIFLTLLRCACVFVLYYEFTTYYYESSFWQSRTPLIISIVISIVVIIWTLSVNEIFKIHTLNEYTPRGCGVYPSSTIVKNLIFDNSYENFRYFRWDNEAIDEFLINSYRKKYDIERVWKECEIATSLAVSIEKIERSELIILINKEIINKPEFHEAREYLKRIIRKYRRYRMFTLMAALLFTVLSFTSVALDAEYITLILLIISMLLYIAWVCIVEQVLLDIEKRYDTPLLKRYSKQFQNRDDRLTFNNDYLIVAYRDLYHIPQHSVQYDWLDVKPIFSMQDGDFCSWMMKNIKYPKDAIRKYIEGDVIVNFVINKHGQLEDIKIIQSAHSLLDSEVVRVISQSPQWSPGKFRNISVPVSYEYKHTFKI